MFWDIFYQKGREMKDLGADIRNKLSPIQTLIELIQVAESDSRVQVYVDELIKTSQESIDEIVEISNQIPVKNELTKEEIIEETLKRR